MRFTEEILTEKFDLVQAVDIRESIGVRFPVFVLRHRTTGELYTVNGQYVRGHKSIYSTPEPMTWYRVARNQQAQRVNFLA